MTKGNEPTSKSGGMNAHLPASEGNNPTASRSVNTEFGGKASKHLGQSCGKKGNKSIASSEPGCE